MNVRISRVNTLRHFKAATAHYLVRFPEIRTRVAAQAGESSRKTATLLFVRARQGVRICADFGPHWLFRKRTVLSCLHEFATHCVSNQACRRMYVKLAHSGRSMRLRRLYAEVQHRADAFIAVAFRNQFNDRLLTR
jgi:molybdopterin/thiamine biosynthesis adenylyltransferase